MRTKTQRAAAFAVVAVFAVFAAVSFVPNFAQDALAQAAATPTPTPAAPAAAAGAPPFDQAAALAKLREQIKGHEQEPASTVFKNIQILKQMPAARLLSVMELGYARSLGITCTHCHIPDKWESEENPNKQIARDMVAMVGKIN